ncbi:hypothetical protein [Caulobacter sp. S45]|uniref:hypothetical protein n=1 Tax=Caulobacter sp. S45 TaxID=1641861 RepID=UPI00131DE90B|nr:hypothetical protein [Caulobacter sp. S45]
MTRTPFSVLASILALGALSACASDGAGHGGGGRGPQGPLPNVFISPEGKPFHAPNGAPYPVGAWFAEADANHDGRLTREEFRQDAAAFFKTLDLNHDGVLDGDEVGRYEESVAPEILPNLGRLKADEGADTSLPLGTDQRNQDTDRSSRKGYRAPRQPGPASGTGIQGAGLFSLLNEPEPVAAADTEFNGRITLKQFVDTADRRFDLLDPKEVGYLTLAKLPKTPVQKEIERRAKQKHAAPPQP